MSDLDKNRSYAFSNCTLLDKVLREQGWNYKEPLSTPAFPKEIQLTGAEIIQLKDKLNALKSWFETQAMLMAVVRWELIKDIGQTYAFSSIAEVCTALDERKVRYPRHYLDGEKSTFRINFNAPRHLSAEKYEKLISDLMAITGNSEADDLNRGEIIRAAFNEVPQPAPSPLVWTRGFTEILSPYPEKQKAFSDALISASSFPFKVKFNEGGKSYEVEVSTKLNQITIAGKEYIFSHPLATIQSFNIVWENIVVKHSSGEISMSKQDFIQKYLQIILTKSTEDKVSIWDKWVFVEMAGNYSPKEIETPKQTVDKWLLEKLTWLKTELEKRIKEWLSPIELVEWLKYVSDNVKDEPTKQVAINIFLNRLSESYILLFEKDGKINVVQKDPKNTATAATYQNAIQSSLSAGHISRSNLQESMTMLTGQKWSDYARTIADPKTANAQWYAKYLADSYGLDIEKKPISQIQTHKTMPATDKAWLLSYMNGQMNTLDIARVTSEYKENAKNLGEFINSDFYAVINKVTGGATLTPDQARQAAEAAARGWESGGDGKSATWALGILAAVVGLGFKKGEGWSLWTSLKRIFMGGLAVGWVMLGCAAGREWKKELGMDVCEEAKKTFKDTLKDMRWTPDTPPAPAPAPTATPTVTPTLTTTQDAAKKKLEGMDELKSKITSLSNTPKNAPFDKYLEFTRSLEGQKLSIFVTPSEQKHSIFSQENSLDPSIQVPSNMDIADLKRVIRAYLTGVDIPYSSLKVNNGTWEDYKSKFDTDKTLHEATKITYNTSQLATQQNQPTEYDETTIKNVKLQWAISTVEAVAKQWEDFEVKYKITEAQGITIQPNPQTIAILYDKNGTPKTNKIALMTWPNTRRPFTVSKNGYTVTLS